MGERVLPEGWVETTLGEVVRIRNGYAFKSSDFLNAGVPVVRQSNLNQNSVDLSKAVFLPPDYLDKYAGFTLKKGDLLIGMSGSIGKLCVYDSEVVSLQNQRTGKIEVKSNEVHLRYIWHFLNTIAERLQGMAKGNGVPNISASEIESVPFPLPPLPEQRRIADKLDTLLGRLEGCREHLDRVPALLKRFRQSVLAAATSGRLTEDWREANGVSETGVDVLRQIEIYRRSNGLASARKEIDTDDIDEPDEVLPATWAWARVGNVVDVRLGGTPSRAHPSYWNGEIPWVSSGEVANCRITTTEQSITAKGLAESNAKLYPAGTVLIAMIGEGKTRGQSAILGVPATTNQNVAGLIMEHESMIPEYVWYWALSHYERNRDVGRGGNQPALNGAKVRALALPIPPTAEQAEIVRRVGRLLSFADRLELRHSEIVQRLYQIGPATLSKALQGDLGPWGQTSNDFG